MSEKDSISISTNIGEIRFGLFFYIYKRNTDVFTREIMIKKGLKEDVRQELYLIALEIKRLGLTDIKEIRRYIARRIYSFLKQYGFRKRKDQQNPKRVIWWFDWEENFSFPIKIKI